MKTKLKRFIGGFTPKHGGVSGRNQAHAIKGKKLAITLLASIALLFTVSIVNADFSKVNGKATIASGLTIAALPVFMIEGKFKELKGDDLATFMKDATPEEMNGYVTEYNKFKIAELNKKIEDRASKEDILALKDEIMRVNESAFKTEIERLAGEVKALKENGRPEVELNFTKAIEKALYAHKDKLDKAKNGGREHIIMEIKAAGTMTTANVTAVGTNGLSMLLNQLEQGITPIPRSLPFFMELLTAVPTTGNTVSYAEMKNPDGGAGMTGEGSAKTEADFDIVEAKSNVRKITSYIKTSKEALDDIPALAGEINGELTTLIKLKADSQLLTGDGTGNNLNGVITQAPAFTGGDLAATIFMPNNFDVLAAAIAEIMTAEVISGQPAGFMPSVIILNPIDFVQMKLTKSTTGEYVFPFQMPGTSDVIDVPIVKNPRMTQGDFLVADLTRANLRIRENIMFDIGYENDDFTKNLVTILAEMRLAFYIKSNHLKAFLTGDFESAKALLTTV